MSAIQTWPRTWTAKTWSDEPFVQLFNDDGAVPAYVFRRLANAQTGCIPRDCDDHLQQALHDTMHAKPDPFAFHQGTWIHNKRYRAIIIRSGGMCTFDILRTFFCAYVFSAVRHNIRIEPQRTISIFGPGELVIDPPDSEPLPQETVIAKELALLVDDVLRTALAKLRTRHPRAWNVLKRRFSRQSFTKERDHSEAPVHDKQYDEIARALGYSQPNGPQRVVANFIRYIQAVILRRTNEIVPARVIESFLRERVDWDP